MVLNPDKVSSIKPFNAPSLRERSLKSGRVRLVR